MELGVKGADVEEAVVRWPPNGFHDDDNWFFKVGECFGCSGAYSDDWPEMFDIRKQGGYHTLSSLRTWNPSSLQTRGDDGGLPDTI